MSDVLSIRDIARVWKPGVENGPDPVWSLTKEGDDTMGLFVTLGIGALAAPWLVGPVAAPGLTISWSAIELAFRNAGRNSHHECAMARVDPCAEHHCAREHRHRVWGSTQRPQSGPWPGAW